MPRRKVTFKSGEYYHVYNRGHNRADIFFEKDDYYLFLRKLVNSSSRKPRSRGVGNAEVSM